MAGATRFLSLAPSVRNIPEGRLVRTDSPAGDSDPSLLQRSELTSPLLPVPAVFRYSVSTFFGDFASIRGLRMKSLLKFGEDQTSLLKRKALVMLVSKHLGSTGVPHKGGFCSNFQYEQLINYRGRNRRHACSCTNHFRASLHSLGMPGTSSIILSLERFLATVAWMFVMPSEALAETCENTNSALFNMPLLFIIALIGATVGGLLARQRKADLSRLNEQLRQINAALRRQAKIESYAPNLSYAPVGRIPETDIIVDPKKQELISILKTGKNYLRQQNPVKAFYEFKSALELAQSLGDSVEEKKATRGLGASLQRQGKFQEAIKYHSLVLSISRRTGEESGSTEAYGAIADCYTELGDLERAGRFYDKYIARLEKD